MKNIQLLIIGALLAVVGCKTTVNLTEYKQKAELAADSGDYFLATEAWRVYFEQYPADEELPGSVYAQAAQDAFQAPDLDQAMAWFEQARQRGYEAPSMHLTLAEIYRYQDNLSRELSELETYKEKATEVSPEVYSRLYTIYYTTGQPEKAMTAWEKMPDVEKRTEQNLERYFSLNKKLDNEAKVDSISRVLLEVAPTNEGALEWLAQRNYQIAEARYQKEMKQYEARPTTGNYQTLLRGLKAASVYYRKSLQYFEKLWEINPEDRNRYAVYMNNIHVRFNDKQKADYYRKFID